ncbi:MULTISPECIES: NPCBM/NEW2 domain-containing protein [unclassified Streptomyces]|uniref:NPCBM/NEW2 domain-containing protein n=1 Tax=unclassified Streptomyces TaxID=2593676 RepID=UPI001BAEDBF0|nr:MULTISPECIES: NPCBM/NEW2 domain-containing protein [unclassified Streptomyces]MDH6447888.1 alpha-galactosidase [Streptomyces sp. SAI-119]MDH6501389.1 alpha-galactosidase [Streptomyces sp. SAI-149]QUC60172.1 NPCBM/NEW2 domain-containing protein [Streptomyces sp. A2-16]
MRHLHTRTTRRRMVAALTVLLFAVPGAPAVADEAGTGSPALADGLALTPPMGFNNWNSTHCRAEFNESMVKGIADIFVDKGLKDAGYQYVNLDDCWALPDRDADGQLVPDPARFPNGIKAVADYVHAKGLKLGIYTSAGTKTCSDVGFPGALGHEYSDARQFADWGVDYLKYDNCNNQGVDARQRYTTMRDALRATGRPIVYSICEWGQNKPWEWAADVGHLWRTTGDISDTWGSMLSILKQNLPLAPHAGPGHWNDPDMLEVGNGGMTDTEYRSHFSMWSVMAAPLLIGSDLRSASAETFEILGNKEVIAVDQDPLGKQGAVVSSEGGRWVVAKEMKDGSRTVALFNESSSPQRVATTATAVGLPGADAYTLRDLWQHRSYNTAGSISATVPAHGTVLVRVFPDRRWHQHPPAVELGLEGSPLVQAGLPAALTTTVTDLGRTPARKVSVRLSGPEGWAVRATSPTSAAALSTGRSLRTKWSVTAPPGTPTGSYDLTLEAGYRSPAGVRVDSTLPFTATVVVPPPAGTSGLGDLPWLSATNGYGPVERNTSNGESAAGDGHPITIGGVVYAKGLGVHAESSVEYYTGAACETVTAQVGVDDEKGANGTVAFEVWADGTKVASTGVLTNAMPAQPLTADVTGARLVRLVVTDAGDGIDSDHADWGDARLSC